MTDSMLPGASPIEATQSDPIGELLALADQLDGFGDLGALDLDAAAVAVAALRTRQAYSSKITDAWAAVLGNKPARPFEAGAQGTPAVLVNRHKRALADLQALNAKHDERRSAIERNGDLSTQGRQKQLDALDAEIVKEREKLLSEARGDVDRLIQTRRSELTKKLPTLVVPKVDSETLRLREAQVQSFGGVHGALGDADLRALVAHLLESRSPFGSAACRFLALRHAGDPGPIAGLASKYAGEARMVSIERLIEQPDLLRAATEALALNRIRSRIDAELGAVRKHAAAVDAFVNGWGQAPLVELLTAA